MTEVRGGGARIATAAALIAGLTVLSRLAGFARTIVFAGAVGSTDLGATYTTANTVPNIIFEIVAGGALASLVVPLLAAPVAAGERRHAAETASAVLTWTLLVLVPLGAAVAVAAGPIMRLLGHGLAPPALATGTQMLRIFAIQVPLYGVGIVLTGVLHAHRRFAWPVLAPLLSSLTVMTAYALFAVVDRPGVSVTQVSRAGELVLAVGTTLGVAVLTLSLLLPVRRLGVALRPRWRMPAQTRRRALGLAAAAVVTVSAQQLTLAYLIYLANGGAGAQDGTLVLFTLAQTVFLVPWAVLAVPMATSAFPALAESANAAAGVPDRFSATLARTARAVVLLCGLGAAGLLALALPLGQVLARITAGDPRPGVIASGIAAFAPGLLGYGLFALLSRALYAAGRARAAAGATVAGWAVTALAAGGLVRADAGGQRVAALALANSVGMTALGLVLLIMVLRVVGRTGLPGFARAAGTAVVGLVAAGAAGAGVAALCAPIAAAPGLGRSVVAAMLAAATAALTYAAAVALCDRATASAVAARGRAGAKANWGRIKRAIDHVTVKVASRR